MDAPRLNLVASADAEDDRVMLVETYIDLNSYVATYIALNFWNMFFVNIFPTAVTSDGTADDDRVSANFSNAT